MQLPANLPSSDSAKLPQVYEAAVTALSECSRIDECQQWADKAEALASYARQSDDDRLRKFADRIQARALRRCGELLKQIPASSGGRPVENSGGRPPELTRSQAANDAGLSEHQRKTALRVANVPEPEFNEQVESETPPTITALAEQGKKPRLLDIGERSPVDFKSATAALAQLRRFAEFAAAHPPEQVSKGVMGSEISKARAYVSAVDAWLDRFVTSLGD